MSSEGTRNGSGSPVSGQDLRSENARLRSRLREAEALITAIRSGAVDALVMGEEDRQRVYEIVGPDHPYRVLVETMQEGAVTLSREGNILYANPAFLRMMRIGSISTISQSSFLSFLAENERETFATYLERGQPFRDEYVLRSGEGVAVPAYLSCSEADLVEINGICVVVTDLTAQKRHEAVVASERLARSILEQAAEPIVVCDEDGRITHASRQAESLCGNPIVHSNFFELFNLPEAIQELPSEVAYTREDGKRVFLLLSSAPLLGPEEVRLGSIHVLTDVTDQRAAAEALEARERELRELNESLEARVTLRTQELHLANQTLVRKNRDLQEFAYVASHDLQEPLRKVSSFADLLRRDYADILPAEGKEYLDRMQRAAIRMSDLLRDLLQFSRVSTHGNPFLWVDLEATLNEVLTDLELAIEEADAKIDVGPLPRIEADPMQIRLLLQNLVGNAVKFRRPGVSPHIRITGQIARDDTGSGIVTDVCRLSVADNGIGFDMKYADRIFGPFQRLHGRLQYPGTGMGLAISRRIVERHFGSIKVESVPDQGATFTVLLPVHQAVTVDPSA